MTAEIIGELHTLLTAAAFAPLTNRAFLRITGTDATRWLNGMVTNSIQALGPGEGNYNFLLNAQGRIQGDCTIYRESFVPEAKYLLKSDTAQIGSLEQLLDRFIIMDDVELAPGLSTGDMPVRSFVHGVALVGPQAANLLLKLMTARKDFAPLRPFPAGTLTPAAFEGNEVLVFTPPLQQSSVHELWCQDRQVIKELYRQLDFHHVPQVSPATLEALRVLEARPRYGTDIRNTDTAKDLPQETNQQHALHFAKGCYLGQEIVERIRSRGQVHRLFTPFRLEGEPPASIPAPLEVEGKAAGELTSAVAVPTSEGPVWLALGYARREFLESRRVFGYPGGLAHPRAAGELA